MMTTCPHSLSIRDQTRKKCENPNENSVEENRPVYSAHENLHFRNIFCAHCHGVNDTKAWVTEPFCNALVDTSHVTKFDDLITLLRNESYCGLRFQPQDSVHKCTGSEAGMVSVCNVTGMWNVDDYNSGIEQACRGILQPLQFEGLTFKNYFCAYCNGMGTLGACISYNRDDIGAPLSILFNFLPEKEVGVSRKHDCRDDEMFDRVKVSWKAFPSEEAQSRKALIICSYVSLIAITSQCSKKWIGLVFKLLIKFENLFFQAII